ncbi:MAG: HEAT repeat domain-containing protein [Desulfohalobiaceae bacterium]|nr:HEAT repeat domain-containing protein [Desulfohalobiaceae bacterium]
MSNLTDTETRQGPENSRTLLHRALQKRRVMDTDRFLDAQLVGDTKAINNQIAKALLSIAEDDEPEILRRRAALSLGPVLELADFQKFDGPEKLPITKQTFQKICSSFCKLFHDEGIPGSVRRSILEASVRAEQRWHEQAVEEAYASGDQAWKLTAVFCMRYVPGFEEEILEALNSSNRDILLHAVCAAGNWRLDKAWPRISSLAGSEKTAKPLRLAAIAALGGIQPHKSQPLLFELISSDDRDIMNAAYDSLGMVDGYLGFYNDPDEGGYEFE